MTARIFTRAEVNALVPQLTAAFRLMLQLRTELRTKHTELEQLGFAPTWATLRTPAEVPPHVRGAHGQFLALAMAMAEQYEAIVATGARVKDPETGLCDFPCLRDERVVLLCWRLGEPAVGFWHELDGGTAERQRLEVAPSASASAATDPATTAPTSNPTEAHS